MNPVAKSLLIGIGGLAILLAVALTVIALTFDPNDYKPQIKAEVKAQTGRELRLEGPLSLKLFPWLAVRAENVELANAEGFSDPVFARIDVAEVRLRLLPLLRRQFRLGQVILEGPVLNLERRADGSTNWDDLAAADEDSVRDDEGKGDAMPPDLAIKGLTLSDARISWRDGDQRTVVEGLNIETGPIADGQPSDLKLAVTVGLADGTELVLDLSSGWTLSLAGPELQITNLIARARASGPAIPAGRQQVELTLDANYDGVAQTAQVREGELRFAEQKVSLGLSASELDSTMRARANLDWKDLDVAHMAKALKLELPQNAANWPRLSGQFSGHAELAAGQVSESELSLSFGELKLTARAVIRSLDALAGEADINVAPLDLHAFAKRLGYELGRPSSAGPTQLDAKLKLAADRVELTELKGRLAGEALRANGQVENFASPALRADLDLAALTLTDWLPKAAAEGDEPAKDSGAGDLDSMAVPLDWAEGLNLTARAKIAQFDAYGVKFRDVIWSADGRPGKPVQQTLSANAYGGKLAMNNRIDATQPEPLLGLNLSAEAVGLGDFLSDGWGQRWITGTTRLNLDLTGRGNTFGDLRRQLNGEASYRLQDGEVQGVSLLDLARKAGAMLNKENYDAKEGSTTFSELAGKAVIESGQLKMRDIGGGNEWLKFDGKGLIDLVKAQYDLRLSPQLLDTQRNREDSRLKRLIGLAVPIQVTGPLTAPKFSLDLEDLIRTEARSRLDGKVEEKKDELRDKVKDKLGDFFKSKRPEPTPTPAP